MFTRSPIRAAAGATGKANALVITISFSISIALQRDPRIWLRQPRTGKKLHQTRKFDIFGHCFPLRQALLHKNFTRPRERAPARARC